MPVEIHLADLVRLRKPHPCGGYDWRIVRLGADIGLRCATCDRRVLLPRREFEKRLKTILKRASEAALLPGAATSSPENPPAPSPEAHRKGGR
jgi:hypothetical protein